MLVIPDTTTTLASYGPANTFVRAEKYTRGWLQVANATTAFVQLWYWPLDAAYDAQPLREFALQQLLGQHHVLAVRAARESLPLAGAGFRSLAGRPVTVRGVFYTASETETVDARAAVGLGAAA